MFYGKNQLNLIVARNVALFDVITILPILSNNKDNVPFTWPAGIQHILFLTIAGYKFVIYVLTGRF
jgi:hypothetical protein